MKTRCTVFHVLIIFQHQRQFEDPPWAVPEHPNLRNPQVIHLRGMDPLAPLVFTSARCKFCRKNINENIDSLSFVYYTLIVENYCVCDN